MHLVAGEPSGAAALVAEDTMQIEVSFPGGKRVDAQVGAHLIRTDQPRGLGGDDSAPGPFDLFLASIASCAGIYVLGFFQARGLSTEGLSVIQHVDLDETTKLPATIRLELRLPASFPERYVSAVIRAAEGCKVKKTLAAAPKIDVVASHPGAEQTVSP
jgi:putative redox protein